MSVVLTPSAAHVSSLSRKLACALLGCALAMPLTAKDVRLTLPKGSKPTPVQKLNQEGVNRALRPPTLERKRASQYEPLRLTSAQAVEEAAAMAERFQRLFVRAIRTLRDLRRYAPSVVVQNAGQVNLAALQQNVAIAERA